MHDAAAKVAALRGRIIDLDHRKVLIACIRGSAQEADLTKPPNCQGYGRIRHFRRHRHGAWPCDPLPMDPACKALGLPRQDVMTAEVFQCAGCNLRCWYCFVPPEVTAGDDRFAAWFSAEELVDLYAQECAPPSIIDLSGGNPELVPEWILWMMDALQRRELDSRVYLWSDDSLTGEVAADSAWREEVDAISKYRNYGRVGCFKGYSEDSFEFNTGVDGAFFEKQFQAMTSLIKTGMDIYAYATFTTPSVCRLDDDIRRFVDRLQAIHRNLPLRTVPLEIVAFSPTKLRLNPGRRLAMQYQHEVAGRWAEELAVRYAPEELTQNIADVAV